MTPTATQQLALGLAAQSASGTIVSCGGGYWVAGDTSLMDRQAVYRGAGKLPWVPTTTVYACERAGWFVRCNPALPRHEDPRRLTDAGRAVLLPTVAR